jgi:hypothetical protein
MALAQQSRIFCSRNIRSSIVKNIEGHDQSFGEICNVFGNDMFVDRGTKFLNEQERKSDTLLRFVKTRMKTYASIFECGLNKSLLKTFVNELSIVLKLKKSACYAQMNDSELFVWFTLMIWTKSSSDSVSRMVSTVWIAMDFFRPVMEPLASIRMITSRGDDVARMYQFCTRQSNRSSRSVSPSGYSHIWPGQTR